MAKKDNSNNIIFGVVLIVAILAIVTAYLLAQPITIQISGKVDGEILGRLLKNIDESNLRVDRITADIEGNIFIQMPLYVVLLGNSELQNYYWRGYYG